jgi:hypothetical protein
MTWETDFRRFEKTDMDYIPGRKDHTGVLLLDSDWHRIGIGLEFFSSSGMLAQSSAWSVYLLFPSLLLLFFSLWFPLFFLCILLAVMLAWTLRSGQPSKCPLISYVRSYVLHRPKGRDHRTGFRSDQIRSIHQSIKGKTNQNNTRVLSYVFRLSDIASRIVSFTYK